MRWSADDVLLRAEQWTSTCNYEVAEQFYRKVLQMDARCTAALDGLAHLLHLRCEAGELLMEDARCEVSRALLAR